MPDEFGETGKVKRTSLRQNRSYEMPGGPYADDLPEVEVKNLAEIERGGAGDAGVQNGR